EAAAADAARPDGAAAAAAHVEACDAAGADASAVGGCALEEACRRVALVEDAARGRAVGVERADHGDVERGELVGYLGGLGVAEAPAAGALARAGVPRSLGRLGRGGGCGGGHVLLLLLFDRRRRRELLHRLE